MCLAIPGKLVEKKEEIGIVDLGGVKKEISLSFLPEVKIGDWVLIHTGFALETISEEEAQKTLSIIREAFAYEKA
ncbi:MAG: HypC/HybG/HupF family hydrogenase formation chaperone [Candidatus Cloacimonadota bacterium]|nr:MAG: HypC/HybG/HupF family hydrogenase formation chaperone [Candidatus Cloacimonadota bacterium]